MTPAPSTFQFDPDRVAYLEWAGWRAYYERRWLKLLALLHEGCREQFHIPFPLSLLAAYYFARASIAWSPKEGNVEAARRYLERFYRLGRRYSGLGFDPRWAALLELVYWVEHRRLVGQSDKEPLVNALADLHAELFGLSPEQARESAVWRTEANNTVDGITSGRPKDVSADWAKIDEQLRRAYRSIQRMLRGEAE